MLFFYVLILSFLYTPLAPGRGDGGEGRSSRKDPRHVGDGHAIVADGNPCLDGEVGTVEELFSGCHAASTLDGHGVLINITGSVVVPA